MGWKLNFTDDTEDSLDGLRANPGWWRTKLEDTHEVPENGNQEFLFKVTGPTMVGAVQKHFLSNPENGTTDDKIAFMARLAKTWSQRLGLTGKDAFGREVEVDWSAAIGREFVLHLKEDSYTGQDGKERTSVKIDWAPYPLDHEKIPPDVRLALGLPLLPGQAVGGEKTAPAKKPRGRAAKTAPPANGSPPPQESIDDIVGTL